jgi:hypothetical protein
MRIGDSDVIKAKNRNGGITTPREFVLVIHGFGGKRLLMYPLCMRLRSRNFRVRTWSYSSLFGSLEQHATKLYEHLAVSLSHESRLHIVAHSMGSIVVRSALSMGTIPNLGRVVFLAPPNSGSPLARVAATFLGRICKPLADVSDGEQSYVKTLPALCEVDVAVVAARFDALVPTANTHLQGERDHMVLNATHNSLLLSGKVASLAALFLRTGTFSKIPTTYE